jgi:two-component system, NarL family, response regulator DevR
MPIRVLAVDDHLAVRHGLRDLLADEEQIELVGVASTAREALIEGLRRAPDVAVVDYQLGRGQRDGLALSIMLKGLPRPPRVLVYSAYADSTLAVRALVAGADGLVSKGSLGTEVTWAIHAVANGRRLLPPVAPEILEALRERLEPEDQPLFGMLLGETTEDEIARVLRIAPDALPARRRLMLQALEEEQLVGVRAR